MAVASDYLFVIRDDGEEIPILSPDWIDIIIGTTVPPPPATPPAPTSQPHAPSPTQAVPPAAPSSAPSCVANPTGRIRDSHERIHMEVVQYFCDKYAQNHERVNPTIRVVESIQGLVHQGLFTSSIDVGDYKGGDKPAWDDVYDITILSVDRCKPTDGFNLPEPVVGHSCSDVLYHAWKDCECSPLIFFIMLFSLLPKSCFSFLSIMVVESSSLICAFISLQVIIKAVADPS